MKDYDLYSRLLDCEMVYEHNYSCNSATSPTLIIHPDDPSTEFLNEIYKGKGFDVVRNPFVENSDINNLIESHERILLLGHGCESGLHAYDRLIINAYHAPLLREKETIFIWCNSDIYVKRYGLKPSLFTGMFISQKDESEIFDIPTNELSIELSNDIFAHAVGKHINSENVLGKVKQEYHDTDDPIITFNRDRLYSNLQEANNA